MANNEDRIFLKGNPGVLFERYHYGRESKPITLVLNTYQAAFIEKNGILIGPLEGGEHEVFDTKLNLFRKPVRTDKNVEADIILLSKSVKLPVKWGTPYTFDVKSVDTGMIIQMGVRGRMEIRIKNAKQFYAELVGPNQTATIEWVKERVQDRVVNKAVDLIPRTIRVNQVPLTELVEWKSDMAKALYPEIKEMLEGEYGVELTVFEIDEIFIPAQYKSVLLKEEEEKRLRRLRKQEEQEDREEEKAERADRIAEIERREDRAFARHIMDRSISSRDLASYALILKQLNMNVPGNIVINTGAPAGKAFCPQCGTQIAPGALFCHVCGSRVPAAPAGQTVTISPAQAMNDAALVSKISNVANDQTYVSDIEKQLKNDPDSANKILNAILNDPDLVKLFNAVKK